jgi:hypothetical protein
MINEIVKAWIPGLKDNYYRIIRTVGKVDLVVVSVKTKKEYLISRYQIMDKGGKEKNKCSGTI